MTSFKSKLFLGLLVNRHWFKLRRKAPYFDGSQEEINKMRAVSEKGADMFGKYPKGISFTESQIDDMYCEWVNTEGAPKDKAILYFHGGMYVLGSAKSHRVHVSKFVHGTGLNAFVFDYGLAPENPFPKGLNDAVKAYKFLLENGYKPQDIVFIGDSAGGGLCLATIHALKKHEMDLPKAVVAMSPWTDLKLTGKSYKTNLRKCLSPPGSAENSSRLYANGECLENPLISPLYGELKGFPPLHISAGSNEILLDDSIAFAEKAKISGVEVKLTIGEGMCHCYPAFGNMLKESKATYNEICEFVKHYVK